MDTTDNTASAPLLITVVHGNLRFVRHPLLLGHYRSLVLTGTESIMDELLGGEMGKALALRTYPDRPKSNRVFLNLIKNPLQKFPRPEAVIVVGLGDEGALLANELAETVRQGALEWAQRERERSDRRSFDLAATLIASGGTGISPGQSACLIAKGVAAANEALAAQSLPRVNKLHLIELYLDRATEAWRALRVQASATPEQLAVTDAIQIGIGGLRRPLDAGYRGTGYDMITAATSKDEQDVRSISYTVDSRRARTEVHTQRTQVPLLQELVRAGATVAQADTRIGRTLFQTLVPLDLEPYLASLTEVVLEVDADTAGIPWEMLETPKVDTHVEEPPWAIRAKLIRKLRTPKRPIERTGKGGDRALVVAEPATGGTKKYEPLPSAREEAKAVVDCLRAAEGSGPTAVTPLIGVSAVEIINAWYQPHWRIVHIAGHGEPPQRSGRTKRRKAGSRSRRYEPGGVVLSNGIFLGPDEIAKMRVVPDLVFVNCCHLAARDTDELLVGEAERDMAAVDRTLFAATVAESLIAIGVRCVIAAGWEIEDEVANTFATTFYNALIHGKARFIEAVVEAREAAYRQGGNTWAAYQCYGDPDWTFRTEQASAPAQSGLRDDVFENIASPTALILTLDTIAVNAQFDEEAGRLLPRDITRLEERFEARWGDAGDVAEAFAVAWGERDVRRAIEWYERALAAKDGKASIRAIEQLNHLRIRLAWESVMPAEAEWPRDQPLAATQRESLDDARNKIKTALEVLDRLTKGIQDSIERASLCASGWKRLAMIEHLAGDEDAERNAIIEMKKRYATAETLARDSKDPNIFYPALNCMAAELILDAGAPDWPGFDETRVRAVNASLDAKNDDDADFWSVAGGAELRLYEAIARNDLAGARSVIDQLYADLRRRVPATRRWASIRDQLHLLLPKYAARASSADREAGETLLRRIEEFARSDQSS